MTTGKIQTSATANIDFTNLGGYTVTDYENFDSLSDETTAFSAVIKLDGKKVGVVKNAGRGGSNDYDFEKGASEAFSLAAKALYPGSEPEDTFVEELITRYEMTEMALKEAGKQRPVILLVRDGVQYIGNDYVHFDKNDFLSCANVATALAEVEKRKPAEYVIFNFVQQQFTAERYQPSEEKKRELELQEKKVEEEMQRRKNAWSIPAPLGEKCPRFVFSENEDNEARLTDTATGREITVSAYTFRIGRELLIKLFGEEQQNKTAAK